MTAIAPFLFWSFVTVAISLAVVGQVVSKTVRFIIMRHEVMNAAKPAKTVEEVLYRTSATPPPTNVMVRPLPTWFRVFVLTLPLHPIVAGAIIGATRLLPVPDAVGQRPWVNAAYFAFAGCISGSVYDFLSKLAARKLGGR